MSRFNHQNRPVLLIFFVIIALINLQISTVFAASNQDNGKDLLKKAQARYHQGEFDQTLQLIRQFLQTDSISKPQRILAYSLLSKTFIAQQKTDSAKEVVHKIFALNPAYHPTLEQEKPSYVHLVDAVRDEIKPKKAESSVKKTKHNTLLWAGTGGAVTFAIILGIVLSRGADNGKSHTLPKPPAFPK